jgi:hypothetical protein
LGLIGFEIRPPEGGTPARPLTVRCHRSDETAHALSPRGPGRCRLGLKINHAAPLTLANAPFRQRGTLHEGLPS